MIRVPDDQYAPLEPVTIAVQAGRFRHPPQGIFGGKPGAKARFLLGDGSADPSGLTQCKPGDVVSFYSAGGGGYGDPFERDVEAVERDVHYGYVSIEKAKEDYGVVIEPGTMKVDLEATKKLRTSSNRNVSS